MSDSIDVGARNLVYEQADHKAGRIIYNLLIVSIILATLPIGMVSTVFSALSFFCFFTLIYACKKRPGLFLKKSITAIILTTALSVVVGCSSMLDNINGEVLTLCDAAQGTSCSYGMSQGVSTFGYPFSNTHNPVNHHKTGTQ